MALDLVKINVPNPTEKTNKYLQMAGSNVTKLTEMVTQLLDISRLEAGKMPLQKTRCNLAATAQTVIDSLNTVKGDRLLTLNAPAPVFATCDPEVVGRILTNLVTNALKFTGPNDAVKITVTESENVARVSVIDHGPGIPAQYRSSIFDKFTQVEGEKRKYGSGLGLTFCKLAVEAHSGIIGVDSSPDLENVFWFTLPLAT
jgi:signal transduction histidine kinase